MTKYTTTRKPNDRLREFVMLKMTQAFVSGMILASVLILILVVIYKVTKP